MTWPGARSDCANFSHSTRSASMLPTMNSASRTHRMIRADPRAICSIPHIKRCRADTTLVLPPAALHELVGRLEELEVLLVVGGVLALDLHPLAAHRRAG